MQTNCGLLQPLRDCQKGLAQPGHPNLRATLAWYQALQSATRGLGLAAFQVQKPVPVQQNQKRVFIAMEGLYRALHRRGHGRKKRALLQTALPSGTSELRFGVDWARRGPVTHDHLDSGSIGMPSKHFLYTDVQLHGWRWPDVIHIENNNSCKNAIIAANLSWARHERSLTSSSKGPFEGAAFFGTLSEAAAMYFDTYDWTDDLYGAAYPLLAFQLCHGRLGLRMARQSTCRIFSRRPGPLRVSARRALL